jgi:hypothetical protein
MARSPIYRSVWLYQLTMRALYHGHYRARQTAIADLIPTGASVVEICSGPAVLHRYLSAKDVAYTGLDLSPRFVSWMRARGIDGRLWDVRSSRPFPRADCVVMQASLYQFLPDPKPVVDRILEAARRRAIIAEPVRNVTSDPGALSRLSARLTDPGTGPAHYRFDAGRLSRFFDTYGAMVEQVFPLPGGREQAYVLRTDRDGNATDRVSDEIPQVGS